MFNRTRADVVWPARALSFLTLFILTSFLAVTRADADLWGHLTFGRDILASGWIHGSDQYSFTSDQPWINHEWLAEVIMWTSYRLGGVAGLVALKLLAACAVGVLVLEAWRDKGLTPLWRDGLLFATALGIWPQFVTIRPQVFSVVLFAGELFVLECVRRGRRLWLLALIPLFALWVNLHGGWLVGGGVLAAFVLGRLFAAGQGWRDRIWMLSISCVSAAATLLNPYGCHMLAFLFETVRPDRADIREWAPVIDLPPIALVLWAIPTVVTMTAFWRNRRSIPLSSLIIVVLLAIGAFRVARLVGFYAVAAGMLVAPYVQARVATREASRPRPVRTWGSALAASLVLVLVATAWLGRIPMDGGSFPEPEAAAFVRANALHGRMLTFFDYGEYAIWHFWPALRVSMDGRRETVYSERTIGRHLALYRGEPDAAVYASELAADYVWLPRSAPGVEALKAHGWSVIFDGSVSTILAPRSEGFAPAPRVDRLARAEFPGP